MACEWKWELNESKHGPTTATAKDNDVKKPYNFERERNEPRDYQYFKCGENIWINKKKLIHAQEQKKRMSTI